MLKIGKLNNIECSIIEGNERYKFSFFKEPSFIQAKEASFMGEVREDLNRTNNAFP